MMFWCNVMTFNYICVLVLLVAPPVGLLVAYATIEVCGLYIAVMHVVIHAWYILYLK